MTTKPATDTKVKPSRQMACQLNQFQIRETLNQLIGYARAGVNWRDIATLFTDETKKLRFNAVLSAMKACAQHSPPRDIETVRKIVCWKDDNGAVGDQIEISF